MIRLSVVVSELHRVSSRAMMDALIAGGAIRSGLRAMARGGMRS
jgi:hypothetical protein